MDFSFAYLMSSLIIGTVGLGIFIFGKKLLRPLPMGIGLAMMIYPYFISNPWVMWLVAVLLTMPLFIFREA